MDYYYYLPQPPYFMVFAGLFISITSGAAFSAALKQAVQRWSKESSSQLLADLRSTAVVLPFAGIAIGTCIFLTAGLELFYFPAWMAFGASLVLTAISCALIWWQLSQLMARVERNGAAAFDLDAQ